MKKFIDVDQTSFRVYTESEHLSKDGALFVMEPFDFHCTIGSHKVVVSIPAGFVFNDKRIPFGLHSVLGTRSLYPQAAAVLEHLYNEATITINGCPVRCSDQQRETIVEKVMFAILERKMARVIAMKLIVFNCGVKINTADSSYGNKTLQLLKLALTKDKSCQHA